MYIYHALINILSVHMIHINLNTIFYTHIEQSPTKTIYTKYYMEKQTHTQTAMNSDMYDIDLCVRPCMHARTHAGTHTHTLSSQDLAGALLIIFKTMSLEPGSEKSDRSLVFIGEIVTSFSVCQSRILTLFHAKGN